MTEIRFPMLYTPPGEDCLRVGYGILDLPGATTSNAPVVVKQDSDNNPAALDLVFRWHEGKFWVPIRGGYPDYASTPYGQLAKLRPDDLHSSKEWSDALAPVPFTDPYGHRGEPTTWTHPRLEGIDDRDMAEGLVGSAAWKRVIARIDAFEDRMVIGDLVYRHSAGPMIHVLGQREDGRPYASLARGWAGAMPDLQTFTLHQLDELAYACPGNLYLSDTYELQPGIDLAELDTGYDPLALGLELAAWNRVLGARRDRLQEFPPRRLEGYVGLRRWLAGRYPGKTPDFNAHDWERASGRRWTDKVDDGSFAVLPDLAKMARSRDWVVGPKGEAVIYALGVAERRIAFRGRQPAAILPLDDAEALEASFP